MIYLYLKTHNKTGLKYLGKTTAKDPHQYQGSGNYWQRHIEKHGYDVTTEILFQTTDKEEFQKVASEYSENFNIVESDDFANLKKEEGDGGWDYVNNNNLNGGKISGRNNVISGQLQNARKSLSVKMKDDVFRKNHSNKVRKGLENSNFNNATFLGKNHSEQTKEKIGKANSEHQKGKGNSQYGTQWICNIELEENKKINKNEEIPEGWVKGRNKWNKPIKKRPKQKKERNIEEWKKNLSKASKGKNKGHKRNSGKNNPMYGKNYKWITDGVIMKKLFTGDTLPTGFYFGTRKNFCKKK